MSDLYLTPTRRAFLLAVHAGNVVDGPDDDGTIHAWEIDPPYKPRKVNALVNSAMAAGWVAEYGHTYRLTPAGEALIGGPS